MQASIKERTQGLPGAVIGLLVGGLLVRSAIAAWLPPGFDEAYYYLYTQHLDWSYFDHPLMVAFTTGLGPWITGQVSQFTIRWGSLLLHTGALLLLYQTSLKLFSPRAAVLTLAIATLIPIFLVGFGVLTLPDSPLIFFWTATLYWAASEFFQPTPTYQPTYRLAIIGLLVGLACLSKYHGVALGVGLLGFCLTQSRYRSVIASPWLWVGMGLFLLAIAPILIWNAQHDWVSLRFQSGRAIPDRGYHPLEALVTGLVNIAYLFPTFGFPLWWVSLRQAGQQLFRSSPTLWATQSRLVLWLALPLMLGFTLMGGYRPILPTWAMPGCWSASLLLGAWAADWPRRWVRRWLWGSGLAIATLLSIALLHLTLGTLQKPSQSAWFGGVIAAHEDASTQLFDVQPIRHAFAASPTLQAALRQTTFIFTDNIYLSGQIGMAIAPLNAPPVTCLDSDPRGFAFWYKPTQWLGQSGLYIASQRQSPTGAERYRPYFADLHQIAEIPIRRGGQIVERLVIYQCQTLLHPYPRPYGI